MASDTNEEKTERSFTLRLHRAQPITGDTPPPFTKIVIDKAIDNSRSGEASQRRMTLFREEARALAIALRQSLPGGTIDALLVELLESKLVQFVVPMAAISNAISTSTQGESGKSEK